MYHFTSNCSKSITFRLDSLSLSHSQLPLFLSIYLKLWYPTMFYIPRLINDARGQISVFRRGEMRKILSSVFIKHLNVTERVNKSSNLLFIKTICGLFLFTQQSAPIFFDIIWLWNIYCISLDIHHLRFSEVLWSDQVLSHA